jgi:pilus assembly protein CpaB
LAAIIPPGMRAVPVRVNDITGVAGFVLPGMRVDVLIAGTTPTVSSTLGTLSRTLLQNVLVLSAGQSLQKDAEGKPIPVTLVNLLVTPEEAETLSLANTETKIQLVLRNPVDDKTVKTSGTAVASLFSGQKFAPQATSTQVAKPRVAARPVIVRAVQQQPDVVVEVIQGNVRNSVKFKEEGQ